MSTYPFEKHDFYLPDNVLLEDFATIPKKYPSKPSLSIGNGEVAYMEDEDEVYVNKGTADAPDWQQMGGGGNIVSNDTDGNVVVSITQGKSIIFETVAPE